MGQSWHGKSRKLNFFYGIGNENQQLGTGFLYTEVSTVNRVKSVSDEMSYMVLRGHWFNTFDFNMHVSREEKHKTQKTVFMRN